MSSTSHSLLPITIIGRHHHHLRYALNHNQHNSQQGSSQKSRTGTLSVKNQHFLRYFSVYFIFVCKTIIPTRIVHRKHCLIVIKKKSRQDTISMMIGVAAATAATVIIDHCKGAKKNTPHNHCAHQNTILHVCCCHAILDVMKQQKVRPQQW